ncbi:hypothetical protein BATDEDRAFT_90395 [Batrachochytrium dendrobatidis JAM81]|uniref:Uncharacterized protein n=2 Tax=Batrachochytrium dendrobatidis TaxID=109871 RepID=F4P7Q2_BATDJ|nr:uncharacterized protein BATDEDRAFT_90395 [Batrachochytrium dendrobatidis JAM81]EGF78460.1 hypothetical protein BATDEDRAFT_90395 [Batrachochytrium dendrobatidis JAM81]KAK5664930.1 hypothetical protein QVD99_008468 [Batrachochytrium dendrobatidis]OAJ43486.1 hypothetical protein BDEG_26844 [Batrachochytrium dendrobatidis JEL423]|eukprot:XP_006680850.1 hypothetical protein BATDEDRAFT_90395 [Batrachochytrium dendrobatidis JAM81]
MKAPTKPKRSALQEWIHWQSITAAIFLINGGLYSFGFQYETTRIFGLQLPFLYIPFSIPGIVSVIGGVLVLLIECHVSFFALLDFHIAKILLFMPLGLFALLQLTLVQPACLFVFISLELAYNAITTMGVSDGKHEELGTRGKTDNGTMLPR